MAAATAAVAALETEKSSLSLDEKALGERVSSLETTISSLESYNAGLEKKLKDAEVNHQQATKDVGTISFKRRIRADEMNVPFHSSKLPLHSNLKPSNPTS